MEEITPPRFTGAFCLSIVTYHLSKLVDSQPKQKFRSRPTLSLCPPKMKTANVWEFQTNSSDPIFWPTKQQKCQELSFFLPLFLAAETKSPCFCMWLLPYFIASWGSRERRSHFQPAEHACLTRCQRMLFWREKEKETKGQSIKEKKKYQEDADLSFHILIRKPAKYRQCNSFWQALSPRVGICGSFKRQTSLGIETFIRRPSLRVCNYNHQ